jgi:ABC-type transport system involved in multi-copper enzyme maturation permease subunit
MSGFITVTTAALALVTIHYHTSTRCVKMVLTKPSPPSVWILSVYCSAVLVAGALFLASFVIALALFLAWGIPFQYGLIFVTVQDFAECLVIYSYLTMLTVIVHPAIALLVALVMQEGMFYYLMILAMAAHQGIAGTVKGILLKALEQLCAFFYMVVPSYSPFKESVKEIARSYRVTGAGWWYLACIVSYALIFTAFCYVVTVLVFKRKRYI